MSNIENEITAELQKLGADFVRFVDISGLPEKQTRSLPRAIVFGLTLTPGYMEEVRKKHSA
ncbi:hypothetical protein LJB95_02155 [Paludibacteraceae bacterium OttesenSCG-928-F17]|nr:hypothetical protein [Paludibacteraceae bacterium OttesenSCG-928-F17]